MPGSTLAAGSCCYVAQATPSTTYPNAPKPQVAPNARAYFYFSLSGIPTDAVITSALLQLVTDNDWPANETVTVQPVEPFSVGTITWNTQPAPIGTAVTATKADASPAGTIVAVDVTTKVTAALSSRAFFFDVALPDTAARYLRGFNTGASPRPTLAISYDVPTPAVVGLAPSGAATGTRTPTLTWSPWEGTTDHQVQISTNATFASPAYDSGDLPGATPQFTLTPGTYQLPTDGSHVYVRVRRKGPQGWGAWSSAAELWYAAKPVVTITTPGSTTSRGAPTVTWSLSSGTQKAFRVRLAQASTVLWDSGQVTSTTQRSVTPSTGISRIGDYATVQVDVLDGVDRIASPGDPIAATASKTFQLVASSSFPAVDDLAASHDNIAPWTVFTWSYNDTPDQWVIVDDSGKVIDTFAGADAIAGTGTFRRVCYYTQPNRPDTYRVAPVYGGDRGAASNAVAHTTPVRGIWLADPATGQTVQLLGKDEIDADETSTVTISRPLEAGYGAVREMNLQGKSGTLPGDAIIASMYGRSAEDQYETMRDFKTRSRPLRLVWALVNIPIVLHSSRINPIRAGVSAGSQRWAVAGSFEQQGENDY